MAQSDPFRALADNAAEAIVTIDEGDRIVYANPAAARVFGYSLEELANLPFTALIPERFRDRHRAGFARFLESGERHLRWDGIELPGRRKDGTEVLLEITFGEYADAGGRRFSGIMRDITDRRAEEERLQRTTQTLEALVQSAPIAIAGLSREGIVELWSPAAERMFGWAEGEVLGHPLPIVAPRQSEEHARLREAAVTGPEVGEVETTRWRKDGTAIDVRISYAPLRQHDGEIRGVMAMFQDITAGLEADRARTRSEHRMSFLAEAGRLLAGSLDPDATLKLVARLAVPHVADWCAIYLVDDGVVRLVEVTHHRPEREEAARQLREIYPPDPKAPRGVHEVIRTGKPELIPEITPEMIRDAAVDPKHAAMVEQLDLRSLLIVPLTARGATIGAISLVAESSSRRFDQDDLHFAAELGARAGLAVDNARLFAQARARADEEAALRQAIQAVAASATVEEVIQAIAAGARVATSADGAFVERIKESPAEMEVVAVHGEATPEQGTRAPLAGSFAEEALRKSEPVHVEDIVQERSPILARLGARVGHAAALVLPLQDGGEPIGTLVLIRAAAGQPFAAPEIARASTFAHLASLAFRRLNLLHETEQRRAELERVTESRARLVRGFSHDVKNPLGAADGHLELLEEGILDPITPKQADSIRRARSAIRSALDLIRDLVELAMAEAAVVEVDRGPTDVAALVRDVAEEHRATAENKGLRLFIELPPETPIIDSDVSRARQILGNLLSNAIKYTDEGSVRVKAEATTQESGRRALAVRVIDSGPGIPHEKRHLIFQEFGRLSRDREGMGLGLAISCRLAHALGGDITADSEPGKGSTFTLWLPLDGSRGGSEVVGRVA